MKAFKKIIFWLFIFVLAAMVASVVLIGFFLGDIVKAGIEKAGPSVTGVSVNVEKVNISLLTGTAGVKGFVVGNPPGYTSPQAISLGEASLGISPFTVFSDKIVIHSIRIIAPDITIEGNLLNGNNNLSKILANAEASNKSGGPVTTNEVTGKTKPAKKFEVDDFLMSGAKVHYGSTTLPLPDIHLTDLGKTEEGITSADLTKQILSQVTVESIKAVAMEATHLGKNIEDLGKNLGAGSGKTLSNGVDKIKQGIGGLFGK
jgi:uncharacterized protein involved in outer membrane biogenesis